MHSYNETSDWLWAHVWDCDAGCRLANGMQAEPELLLRGVAWNRVSWVFSLCQFLTLSLSLSHWLLALPLPSLTPSPPPSVPHIYKYIYSFFFVFLLHLYTCRLENSLHISRRSRDVRAPRRRARVHPWKFVSRTAHVTVAFFFFFFSFARMRPCVKSPSPWDWGAPQLEGGGFENEPGCIVYEAGVA